MNVGRLARAWVALLGFAACAQTARADDPDAAAAEPPRYDEFVVIPLRVHVLAADDLPEVQCGLTDADIARIVGKVNRVWAQAGIFFGIESLVREPAARQKRFRLVRDLEGAAPLGLYRILLPDGSRRFDGLHVYYVHELPVNGVYMDDDFALVKETARLRPVEGGIDEPIPRVTSHELGHALGLAHREDRINLLASGTTGTRLNTSEAATARAAAKQVKGAMSVTAVRAQVDEAERRGDVERARRLLSWLAEVPADGAAEARRRLDALSAPQRPNGETSGR